MPWGNRYQGRMQAPPSIALCILGIIIGILAMGWLLNLHKTLSSELEVECKYQVVMSNPRQSEELSWYCPYVLEPAWLMRRYHKYKPTYRSAFSLF